MARLWNKIKDQSAGAMVENVIVLPIVFVVIMFMIVSAFLIHDRATIESAARRGVSYASYCVSDPNYNTLIDQKNGALDFVGDAGALTFSSIGKNIKAYRYVTGGPKVDSLVTERVKAIVNQTRINWTSQDSIQVKCTQKNRFIYQDITVSVTATYSLPKWFSMFGMETVYKVSTEAHLSAVDPDEFIRNADMVVDIIVEIDKATGGHLANAKDKVDDMLSKVTTRLSEWVSPKKE